MAVVTSTVLLTESSVPYIGAAPTRDQWPTNIPRSEKIFTAINAAVTVAAGGDTQAIVMNQVLAEGFAYVMLEGAVQLSGADVADWNTAIFATLDDTTANPRFRDIYQVDRGGVSSVGGGGAALSTCYRCTSCPTKMLIPSTSPGGQNRWVLENIVPDGVAMTVICFFRFLVFDLNQAYHWAVNTPLPVR